MIILLDLNYTLVSNSHVKRRPFIRQIAGEEYRQWLVELLREEYVILVTARPESYRDVTLKRIAEVTGWLPDRAHFNDLRLPPPALKKRILLERIFPHLVRKPTGYLALESNPKTRAMYERQGVKAIRVPEEPWTTLPMD